MKKVAIMQPYFLPYIGYFQLLNAVDEFVIYDNIQFSKKGWIHRNRMLSNGKDEYFSLSLKKDSDFLDINERYLSETWKQDREKLLRKIKENYRKAPFFEEVFPLLQSVFLFDETNLFTFIQHSLISICSHIGLTTKISISSSLACNHALKSQERVMDICKNREASHYLNPIGGMELYDSEAFMKNGIELSFLKSKSIVYGQQNVEFVPWLSILDVLMFNDISKIKSWLSEFEILKNTPDNE